MTKQRQRGTGPMMSSVLTLRLTEEEMRLFKVAAINMQTKRSKIVRSRISDLIREKPSKSAARGCGSIAKSTGMRGLHAKELLPETKLPSGEMAQLGSQTGSPKKR